MPTGKLYVSVQMRPLVQVAQRAKRRQPHSVDHCVGRCAYRPTIVPNLLGRFQPDARFLIKDLGLYPLDEG
jgi:hypothetical protein